VLKEGTDLTLIGYGYDLGLIEKAVVKAEEDFGISCEIIDLRTLLPLDVDTLA
jgi:2-oxoisovalerate dehydrogenase E1 component beta subunit